MGGRGTFASGKNVDFTYQTVGMINGVKVLTGLNGLHSLPEEAHSSTAYIKLRRDGTFHEMRIYNKDKLVVTEIAYHPEPRLDISRHNVLHIHEYKTPGDFSHNNRRARLLTPDELKKFRPYLVGVKL